MGPAGEARCSCAPDGLTHREPGDAAAGESAGADAEPADKPSEDLVQKVIQMFGGEVVK